MKVRKASFAGSWYPASAEACKQEIESFLSHGPGRELTRRVWSGGIVPHAGWFYSGDLAASVIHLLTDDRRPEVVVIFGMHLHPQSSNHIMPEGAWQTPLGDVPVSVDLASHLLERFSFHIETPRQFVPDNTIEVQLPLIKFILDPSQILGLGVPPTGEAVAIGQAVGRWAMDNQRHIKILGSTDLTHYGANYDFAPHGEGSRAVAWVRKHNDRRMIDAILAMDPEQVLKEGLQHRNACCAGAVAAAMAACRELGAANAEMVAYSSSYDRSPGDSFVGYTGVVFG